MSDTPTPPAPLAEGRTHRRRLLLAGAVLVLVAGGLAGWWYDRQRQETRQAVTATLDGVEANLRADRLDAAEAGLVQARQRLAGGGPADLVERLAALDREHALARRLERLFFDRWTPRPGQPTTGPTLAGYAALFAEYGLPVPGTDVAALVAGLDRSPVRSRLVRGLEEWLTTAPPGEDRRALAALLDALDADALRREAREAFAREDGATLARIAAEVPDDQRTASLALLLAEQAAVPREDRLRLLRTAHNREPGDAGVAFALAALLSREPTGPGDLLEAEGALRAVLAIAPQNAAAWTHLGRLLLERQQPERAAVACEMAVRLDSTIALAQHNLGAACRELRQWDRAVPAYRAAVRLVPDSLQARLGLAQALFETNALDAALKEYDAAIRLDPREPAGHNGRGQVFYWKSDMARAVAAYEQALKLDPAYVLAWRNLGYALGEQGRGDEAMAAFHRGYELGLHDPAWQKEAADWLALADRLPRLLEGAEDASPAELAVFAWFCGEYPRYHADAVRLYQTAFVADPALADDLRREHRYAAACNAVRAAAGVGLHPPTTAERLALRRQALDWLRDDLEARRTTRSFYAPRWLEDYRLESVREPTALARLPADERAAWEALWHDVRAAERSRQP